MNRVFEKVKMMIELKIDTLFRAIESNITIEMRPAEQSHQDVLFFSKLLAYDVENKTIIIDFPIASAQLMAFKVNDPVVIKFIYTDSPFIFDSQVLDLYCSHLTSEPGTRKMMLAMPEKILGEERRGYLKLNTPPFMVTVKVIKSMDIAKQLSKRTYKSTAVNISGGGIAIENEADKLPLIAGDILELVISLPGNDAKIEGEVLNRYPFENSQRVSFGIRFLQEKVDAVCYKRTVKSITQYVMRRERELLSKQ